MRYHRLLWLLLALSALLINACEQEQAQTVRVPTLPPPPDIPSNLDVLGAENIGAVELLGVYQHAPITAAALHSQSDSALLGDGQGRVWLFDLNTGSVDQTVREMDAAVRAVAFSANGTLIAAADDEGTVRVWNRQSAEAQFTLNDADAAILALAFSPDGARLAGGGRQGIVWVWSTRDGAIERQTSALPTTARSLAFSADGQRLAVGSRDGRISIISFAESEAPSAAPTSTPEAEPTNEATAVPTEEVADAENSTPMPTNTDDVRAADFADVYTLHEDAVTALLALTDSFFISGDFSGKVVFYDVDAQNARYDGVSLAPINGDPSGVRSLSLSAEGDVLTVGYRFGQAYSYDLRTQALLDTTTLPRDPFSGDELLTAGYFREGTILVIITQRGQFWLYGAERGARPTATPTATDTPTPTSTFTPTNTPTNTATPSDTPTGTAVNTARPSDTSTPSPAATHTPTNEADSTVAPTSETSITPTATRTSRPTRTPTVAATATPTEAPIECIVSPPSGTTPRIRSGPSTTFSPSGGLNAPTEADGQIEGADGFIWYRLVDDLGWVREDVVIASEGCAELPFVTFSLE